MISLLLRNLIFTLLQPGIVVGLIPYIITRNELPTLYANPFHFHHYVGISIAFTGALILLSCIYKFAVEGHGTLSPADPTKRLVTSGLYRYTRNPMYMGVVLILIGETIIVRSFHLWIYAILIFLAFYAFIKFFEEPRLRRAFEDDYDKYCKNVRRWI